MLVFPRHSLPVPAEMAHRHRAIEEALETKETFGFKRCTSGPKLKA